MILCLDAMAIRVKDIHATEKEQLAENGLFVLLMSYVLLHGGLFTLFALLMFLQPTSRMLYILGCRPIYSAI